MWNRYDLRENDAILADAARLPLYADVESHYSVKYHPGGATLNTIKLAQWMLGKHHATTYFGCIGTALLHYCLHFIIAYSFSDSRSSLYYILHCFIISFFPSFVLSFFPSFYVS